MGIENDNFSAVVNPEQISREAPDFTFGPYNTVRFMSDSVRAKAQPDNLCPACGPLSSNDASSKYCPGHLLEMLTKYCAKRPDSPLNQGLNRLIAASQQPIIPHAA